MQEFHFRPVEISANYHISGLTTYTGFIVENNGIESIMRWENTQIHNFPDSRFDYISVAVESLLHVLGKEPESDSPQKIIIQIDNDTEDLAMRLQQNNFPRIFQPLPSPGELEVYSRVGAANLDTFLGEVG